MTFAWRPSSFNKERLSHLRDSTVAGPTARRDNVLASKCEYPPFRYPPFKCALRKPCKTSRSLAAKIILVAIASPLRLCRSSSVKFLNFFWEGILAGILRTHTMKAQHSFRKIPVSVKFVSAILGPEMGVPILWTPGKNAFFLQEKPCP